jgi:uncharacterized membrane protein YjgN (DUF898 family)
MDAHAPLPWARLTATIRFTGANAVFRRLVTRGALLELVTFGFYRFWLTTDIRRHLWSNTEIDRDALEYTGRGKELLLGFLIALAVLLPLFLLYFLIGIAFERYKAFASLPLYGFVLLFGQFAVYRARRYRLTRTIWRGVRFWMTGSGWSYAWRSLLWGLLLIPTLGFAYPWRTAALERYKLGHTFYGTLPARFAATGWQLFRRVWWIWCLGLLPFGVVVGGAIAAAVAKQQGFGSDRLQMQVIGLIVIGGSLLFIALPFLHAVRKATEWRWWVEGIRFGDLSVTSILSRGALIGVYWALLGMGLLVMLGFGAVAGGIAMLFSTIASHATGLAAGSAHGPAGAFATALARMPIWGMVAYGVWYLAMLLAFGVLARIYTLQRVWRRVIDSSTLLHPEAVTDVAAAGEAASALGEGLADGLDFAGF